MAGSLDNKHNFTEMTTNPIKFQALRGLLAAMVIAASLATPLDQHNVTKVSCPEGFTALGSSCYFFSDLSETFDGAREVCRSMLSEEDGVDLAVFGPGLEEFGRVTNYMHANGITRAFIGVNDNANDGDWLWVDGSALSASSTMWDCSEPFVGETYNCGLLAPYSSSPTIRFYLETIQCDSRYGFICEYEVHA